MTTNVTDPVETPVKTPETMDFTDITLKEIPVQVGDKKYTLREATGDAACLYRNAMLRCTKLGPEGKPETITGIADAEPYLVSLCLFNEGNKPVPVATIRKWPARVQTALFDKAKEISELGEDEDEDTAKNEQSDTMGG